MTQNPTLEIVRFTGDRTASLRGWHDLNPEERKRRALQAARDRDEGVLQDLLEAHLTLYGDRGAQTSLNTLRVYAVGLKQFLEFAQAQSLLTPTRDFGAALKATLAARFAPSSVNVKLAAARHLYAALRWAGATEVDPFRDVRSQPDPTPAWAKREAYPQEDVEALLRVADPRETVLVLLCCHAGLRVSEACAVRLEDIQGDYAIVQAGKGGKRGKVRLSKRLKQAIQAMPRPTRKGGTGALVGIGSIRARQMMQRLCARAKVTYRAVHALRHTAGVRLYKETRDLVAVQRQLRHSSINTSRTYAEGDDQSTVGIIEW